MMPFLLPPRVGGGGGGDITTGLNGWWKFDDGSGTSAADSAGSNTGTLSGGTIPTWNGSGMVGTNSLNFGGVGYVTCGNNVSLDTAAVTLSAWVKPSSFPNGYNTIISSVNGNDYHQVFVKSSGKMAVYFHGNADISYDGTGSTTLSTGVWQFICVTYDSAHGMVSTINNSTDATVAANGTLTTGNLPTLSIGTDLGTAGRQWNGDIDDARYYNRALVAADITTLYAYR